MKASDRNSPGTRKHLYRWARVMALVTAFYTLPAQGQVTTEKLQEKCKAHQKDECIVRYFKDSKEASLIRGKIAFQHYCILCHGVTGEGNGRAARLHNPPPANLTKSVAPVDYTELIIRRGGEGVGRYRGMPPWEEQLTEEQIRDIAQYVHTLRK